MIVQAKLQEEEKKSPQSDDAREPDPPPREGMKSQPAFPKRITEGQDPKPDTGKSDSGSN